MPALGVEIPITFTTLATNSILSSNKTLGKSINSVAAAMDNAGFKAAFMSEKYTKLQTAKIEMMTKEGGILKANSILAQNVSKVFALTEMAADLETVNTGLEKFAKAMYPEGGDLQKNIISAMKTSVDDFDLKQLDQVKKSITDITQLSGTLGSKNETILNALSQNLIAAVEGGDKGTIKKATNQLDSFRSRIEMIGKARGFVKQMGLIAKSAIGLTAFISILREVASAQEEVAKTAYEMGLAYEDSAGRSSIGLNTLSGNVRRSADAMGDSALRIGTASKVGFGEAAKAMSQIARLKITKNIDEMEDLAGLSIDMGLALGVSSDSAAQFIKDLTVIGGVPVKMVKKASDAIVTVKVNLGLTGEEVTAVMSQVGKMMRQFQLFGGSAKQVDLVVREVAKLSDVFTRAGLEASEAHDMLNKLLDPTAIETNVMLWKGLGMTVSQGMALMHGDGTQLTDIAERQVQLARSLKAQYGGNIWALKAMAEAHGMSLATVQGLAAVQKKISKEDQKAIDTREAADAARQGMMSQLKMLWDSISIVLHKAIFPILNAIVPVIGWIANAVAKISGLFDKITKKGNEMTGWSKAWRKILSWVLNVGLAGIIVSIFSGNRAVGMLLKGFMKIGSYILKGGLIKSLKAIVTSIRAAKIAQGGFLKNLFKTFVLKKKITVLDKVDQASKATKTVTDVASGTTSTVAAVGKTTSAFATAASIAAVALALLAMGAAIWMVTNGLTSLAVAMKDFSPEQMKEFGGIILKILIPVMIGFGIAIFALGLISAGAAGPILAVGLAILMIGAGVALIIFAFTGLIKALGSLGENFAVIGPGIFEAAAGMGLLVAALALLVYASFLAGPGLILLAAGVAAITLSLFFGNKGIERFANSMMILGEGMKSLSDYSALALISLNSIIGTLNSAKFSDNFLDQITLISEALKDLTNESPIIRLLAKSDMSQVNGRTTENVGNGGVVGAIERSNIFLEAIKDNTKNTVTAIDELKKAIVIIRPPQTINV